MLCYVVEPDKIMMTIANCCCRRKREVEGGLESGFSVFISLERLVLSFKLTYALHIAELVPNNLNDALRLQP